MSKRFLSCAVVVAVSALAPAITAKAELIYGLSEVGNLFTFDSASPNTIQSGKFISNLQPNEQIVAIDVRPLNGLLYGVSSFSRLYTLNASTGAASFQANIQTPIDGTNFDMDFNPVTDRLRLVSDTRINYSIDPGSGAVVVGSGLTYGTSTSANIAGIAYSNNVANAQTTSNFAIDSGVDTLNTLAASPSGNLTNVGSLGAGINTGDLVGFDISNTGIAYASLLPVGSSASNLYTVNTSTGAVTLVGTIGGGFMVRDIALVSGGGVNGGVPEPATLSVMGIAASALLVRRRRQA